MEGSIFYCLCWGGWIIATFMMKKNTQRNLTAVFLLLLIMGASANIPLGVFHVNGSTVVLIVYGFCILAKQTTWKIIYSVISTTVVAMIYATFHLIELYDPVWIAINRVVMLSGLLVYGVILLVKERQMRVAILFIGIVQGEWFVALVLKKFGFHNDIGSYAFLDVLSGSIALMYSLYTLFKGFTYLEQFKQKQVRERQG
ncbi:hypothetical protein [Bacillus sp. 165]|uniref:YphA family membrane protein n=1 Tax=Bacillus sp. 165 TaxID=1529117 RepID=UPI001ADD4A27|nr:hypothetical protein [Bacillus sp. 165]MBO9128257.1 hypothetical protein [Bacillus sp. 165]